MVGKLASLEHSTSSLPYSRGKIVLRELCTKSYRSLFSHLRPSVKKPEMTALKAGDTFPGDVKFRYALHAAPTPTMHPLNLYACSLQLGALYRREGLHHVLRHSSDL